MDFYPVEESLIEGAGSSSSSNEGVMIVDVGGGMGADLEIFRKRFTHVEGELVLQDQRETIERTEGAIDVGIKTMVHDFFTKQPVEGTFPSFSSLRPEQTARLGKY